MCELSSASNEPAFPPVELSVVIPALNERENLERLIPELRVVLDRLTHSWEIVVVDGGSTDGTPQAALQLGARVVSQKDPGYGGAIVTGFREARGSYIVTMDADLSHPPVYIEELWRRRAADLILASRFVPGGGAQMSGYRLALSRILNVVFPKLLRIPVYDMSTGFRLYRRAMLEGLNPKARDFDIAQEVVALIHRRGGRILEIPFRYMPRGSGSSHARVLRFGWSYLKTLCRLTVPRYFR